MNEDENGLIAELKALTRRGSFLAPCQSEYEGLLQHANPPVTRGELLHAEKHLGYALPPLLQRIYEEVGNGGFGPGYGLLPLLSPEQEDEEDTYYSVVQGTLLERNIRWPARLLLLCHWGCWIASSLEVSSPTGPMVRSEQGVPWRVEAPSLYHWLRAWLDGKPLFRENRDVPRIPFA